MLKDKYDKEEDYRAKAPERKIQFTFTESSTPMIHKYEPRPEHTREVIVNNNIVDKDIMKITPSR